MRRCVLVVDDERAIVSAVQMYVDGADFEVSTAVDFDGAQALLMAKRYDVVITDLRLSGREGTEGLDIVRLAREMWPETKTMLMTAYGSSEVEAQARALGVDCYLQKPVALSELEALIHAFFLPKDSN